MITRLHLLSTLFENKVDCFSDGGRCVTCLAEPASSGLCPGCRDDLPSIRWACQCCGLPLPFAGPGLRCGECRVAPPPYWASVIPWRYQFPVDGMISRYKYHGQRKFVRPLLAGLSEHLEQQLTPENRPELLVPAPMHWLRKWQRGFNQAEDIAEYTGARLNIPVATSLVRRRRRVKAQRDLDRAGRLANLSGVFEARGPAPGRVAIVDDVVTTGATVRLLASVLRDAGAREIQVWALARTPG
ncbi:MAG TPA: ComF family protein [Marinobacter sp.]|nr:ComF family protein [Marinobacter sp.]